MFFELLGSGISDKLLFRLGINVWRARNMDWVIGRIEYVFVVNVLTISTLIKISY